MLSEIKICMHGSLFRNMVDWLYMAVGYMKSEFKDFFEWKSSAAVVMY